RARRRALRDTLVVGVTGTAGTTTTKHLISAGLGARLPGRSNKESRNRIDEMLLVLGRVRRSDRFLVLELGARGPDSLDELLWTLEPDVGVVTAVGIEHRSAFKTVEAVAREKAKLVAWLPRAGCAVLNADDPAVRAMRGQTSARTVLVGRSPDADLRAEEIESAWPQPLRFTLCCGDERLRVETRLHGEHWVPAVLAALAVGREAGVPLAAGIETLSTLPPERHRLSEVQLANGVTVLEDNWKAPAWSVDLSIEVLRRASAARKIAVLGQISDSALEPRKLYRRVAARFLEVADVVVVVGAWARYVKPPAPGGGELFGVATAREADALLREILRPGDLLLIKSNRQPDHLERLVLTRQDGVLCWRTDCGRKQWCYRCSLRFRPER
ncbi:MAG: Mur ligase family protein, partial [Thermoanaerobaculia bacterium]|nr:Mur ligase family protein [Thermoanaerobaculia bacterium]